MRGGQVEEGGRRVDEGWGGGDQGEGWRVGQHLPALPGKILQSIGVAHADRLSSRLQYVCRASDIHTFKHSHTDTQTHRHMQAQSTLVSGVWATILKTF